MTASTIISRLFDPNLAIKHVRFWFFAYLILTAAAFIFIFIDSRILPSGNSVMLKPMKFAVSFVLHCATLWLLGMWLSRIAANDYWFALGIWVTLFSLLSETIAIGTQGIRGVESHFNYKTALDCAMFTIMGLGTLGIVAGAILIFIGILKYRGEASRLMQYSVCIGILLMFLGCAIGVYMVMPTPEQVKDIMNGFHNSIIGSHSKGSPTGPNIPILGWNLVSGDWRAPHFIGIHGFQFIPLIAFVLAKTSLSRQAIWFSFITSSLLYTAFFIWSVIQTAKGKSLLFWDHSSITAILALLLAILLIAGLTYFFNRQYEGFPYD